MVYPRKHNTVKPETVYMVMLQHDDGGREILYDRYHVGEVISADILKAFKQGFVGAAIYKSWNNADGDRAWFPVSTWLKDEANGEGYAIVHGEHWPRECLGRDVLVHIDVTGKRTILQKTYEVHDEVGYEIRVSSTDPTWMDEFARANAPGGKTYADEQVVLWWPFGRNSGKTAAAAGAEALMSGPSGLESNLAKISRLEQQLAAAKRGEGMFKAAWQDACLAYNKAVDTRDQLAETNQKLRDAAVHYKQTIDRLCEERDSKARDSETYKKAWESTLARLGEVKAAARNA